jgi:hypothetical protein
MFRFICFHRPGPAQSTATSSRWFAALVATAMLSGCREGDAGAGNRGLSARSDPNAPAAPAAPTGVSIAGRWKGTFFDPVANTTQGIRASISQDGDQVTIDTTLPDVGSFLTGTIRPNGHIRLTDAWDGETWTTHAGPATSSHIIIQDYVRDPTTGSMNLLNTIDLTR